MENPPITDFVRVSFQLTINIFTVLDVWIIKLFLFLCRAKENVFSTPAKCIFTTGKLYKTFWEVRDCKI